MSKHIAGIDPAYSSTGINALLFMTDQKTNLLSELDHYSDWSIKKQGVSIFVMADSNTCFVRTEIEQAVEILVKALEARKAGSMAAILEVSKKHPPN